MLVTNQKTIESWYDHAVHCAGEDGIAPVAVKAELVQKWMKSARANGAEEVLDAELLEEIGRLVISDAVSRIRQGRNSTKSRSMKILVEAITEGWIADLPPEQLDKAYPVGNGTDKTLGEWRADDLGEWLHASGQALNEAMVAHERNQAAYALIIPKVGGDKTIRQAWVEAGGVENVRTGEAA